MEELKKVVENNDESVTGLEAEVEEGVVVIEEKEKAIDELTTEKLEAQLSNANLELDNQKHKLEIKESENKENIMILILSMFG